MIQIIPAIDIIDGKCVRLCQGDYDRKSVYTVSPSDMVKRFADSGLLRIHAVDLDGAKSGEPVNLRTLEAMASAANGVEIEWGGGLTSHHALKQARDAGLHYAVIGSLAARNPELFSQWLEEFGPEMMVLGADVRNGVVAVSGWMEDTDCSAEQLITKFIPHGLKQSIVTQIACDGMLKGPDFPLYTSLQEKFQDVDFTVSGGVGSIEDIIKGDELGLRRIIVGKALYEGRIDLRQLSKLIEHGDVPL